MTSTVFTRRRSRRPASDVRARRVLDRREVAVAGWAGRDLPAAVLGSPSSPVGPPRAFVIARALEPGFRARRERLVGPIAVLFGGRRIDHARDVTGRTEHETFRSRNQPD